MPLQRVDVVHPVSPRTAAHAAAAVLELAHRDVAGVVADEDVAGAGVVVEAGAPRRAEVAAQPPPARGAVELEIPADRREVGVD